MSIRRRVETRAEAEFDASVAPAAPEPPATSAPRAARSIPASTPIAVALSREEAQERYVTFRDAWVAAMRRSNSGRAADMASLAIAQEAYEEASAEVQLWRTGSRIAIPIQVDRESRLDVAVGQELAWRRVREADEKPRRLLSRLFGRSRHP